MEMTQEMKDAIKAAVTEAVGPINEQIKTLADGNKASSETINALKSQVESLVEDDSANQVTGAKKPGEKPEGKKTGDDDANAGASALDAEGVKKTVLDVLKERDDAANATAQAQRDAETYLTKHAPKIAKNALAVRLMSQAKTDEERGSALEELKGAITATGAKLPDLTSSPDAEGGNAPDDSTSQEAKRTAALEAAGKIRTQQL